MAKKNKGIPTIVSWDTLKNVVMQGDEIIQRIKEQKKMSRSDEARLKLVLKRLREQLTR